LFLKGLERLAAEENVLVFTLIPDRPPWGKLCLGLVRARYGAEREKL